METNQLQVFSVTNTNIQIYYIHNLFYFSFFILTL